MELENKEIAQGADKPQEKEPNTATAVIYHVEKAARQGYIFVTAAFAALTIALGVLLAHQMNINYKNDREWRELFSQYDYVSQDGNGQNYYNSGVEGDVNNGTTSTEFKEQE